MKQLRFKRMMSLLLSAALLTATVATTAGCGDNSASGDSEAGTTASAESESAAAEESAGTDADTEGTTDTDGSNADIDDVSSVEFVRMMGNGINLGNTMEAYGHNQGTGMTTAAYETMWGQPITTEEMIVGMKEAGFDTLRIPVAWTNMMDYESGDYTIAEEYLDRVEEIVRWAVDADMYVIINDHWDGGWWGMFGSATEETVDAAWELYESMWTQIADRFADYSSQVIFESANEELGTGLNSTSVATDSGGLTEDELYALTNEINQKFVDIVRASGGNNENRFLLIAGYNTNIANTCDERFEMPEDSAEDKLLISVHFYDPWDFCSEDQETQPQWGTKAEFESMKESLEMMTQFTDAGIGVVIGEYGAMPLADGTYKNDMNAYHQAILDLCTMYDYCPILWDRGDFYSKTDCALGDEDMAEIYASRSYAAECATSADVKSVAEEDFEALVEAAPEEEEAEEIDASTLDGSMAWIMWNSGYTYSVGDTYNPDDCTEGIVAVDAEVTGAGTYTISLDFTGTESGSAWGVTFSAIGVSNAEVLYPGYIIDIQQILVNGEEISLIATPYTSSDDGLCTRVNLYNQWVSELPDDARTLSGDLTDASPMIINTGDFAQVDTLEITFEFVAP